MLDERTLELRLGGELVRLEPKPLELLRYLLQHAGEVVTKDELAEALWPGRILTETVLTKCVGKLRQALRDDGEGLRTVHGYGYRLVVPVRVESAATEPAPAHFAFRAGDAPPLRPTWRLMERLGAGGRGEAWLARQAKSGEQRVFKFALDAGGLSSLKREITLSRLLRETLPERVDYVRVLDWNLDEPPFFIECEHVVGGDLASWAAGRGGLAAVPLATRLEVLAQAADALAAAHAVGVLHKDLKPANLLADGAGAAPRIRLADFGSAALLDPSRLEALGITRLGLTQALAPGESGTPAYLAPEVLAGQPFTVQADVFALGVLLYQLVAGDFRKPLAPGWERDVPDELLREDIAHAAAGDPAHRLADAAVLARGLRTLDARRAARAAEVEARERAAREQLLVQRWRRRRRGVLGALAAAVATCAAVSWLYLDSQHARLQAEEAAMVTRAVSDFLNRDLLGSADPFRENRDLRVRDVLDRAAQSVAARFEGQPEAAAQVHATLGSSYLSLGVPHLAAEHLQKAADLFAASVGPAAEPRLAAMEHLGQALMNTARTEQACRVYEEIIAHRSIATPPPTRLLANRGQLAWCRYGTGELLASAAQMQEALDEARRTEPADPALLEHLQRMLGQIRLGLGDVAAAEPLLRDVLRRRSEQAGPHHATTAVQRIYYGRVLRELDRLPEAESESLQALDDLKATLGEEHVQVTYGLRALGVLRLRQERYAEAAALLKDALDRNVRLFGQDDQDSAWFAYELAEAYARQGNTQAALKLLRPALETGDAIDGPGHPATVSARALLAEVLLLQGDTAAALAHVAAMPSEVLQRLPPQHPALGEWRRVEGLVRMAHGDRERASAALHEALRVHETRFGSQHSRTRRIAEQLARATA